MRSGALSTGWWFALLVVVLLAGLGRPAPAVAQPDSARAAILEAKGLPPDHTPRKALWRAVAFPGWGQYYNRQYFKIPLVYAGLAGIAAAIVYTNDQHRLYHHAYLYKAWEDTDNEYPEFEEEYRLISNRIGGGGEIRQTFLKDQRDKYRRYRDLSVVGVGLYYALAVLDAYVSAHLLTFDVGEDLSMRVHPAPHGMTAQLHWRF